ncbi:MAG: methyltransferase domain-containing protein [Acidobacteriota bacterium]|nr:methyltransferase domain-containing protein [Acidobacteriota bacterium]
MSVLAPEKGCLLLDVACGGGYLLAEAEAYGLQATGVDFSSEAVKLSHANAARSEVVLGDGECLPFADDSFDYVANLGSLEHFFNPEAGVREMRRVLKKNGRVLVLVPNSYFLMTVWNVFCQGATGRTTEQMLDRWATRVEWSEMLQAGGFRIDKVLKHNYSSRCSPLLYKIVRPFIPLNLSYSFLFCCSKP